MKPKLNTKTCFRCRCGNYCSADLVSFLF